MRKARATTPGRRHVMSDSRFPSWLRWTMFFALLGVALRVLQFARNPSVWLDEAALVVNVVELGFRQLLGGLLFSEAAPPLFLWIEKALSLVAGDSTYVLRFPALLAGCITVGLMVPLARGVLAPSRVPVAVMLVACSDRLIWHAAEAKPYAIDACCAALLAAIFVRTRCWPLCRQLLVYGALAPPIIWLVYPGGFLFGGVLVATWVGLWRAQDATTRAAYAVLATAVGLAFLLLIVGPAGAQRTAALDSVWLDAFPDYHRVWTIPWWTVRQSFSIADYCFRPTGGVLLLPALVGAYSLWSRGQRQLVLLLATPLVLAWIAAMLLRYPYAGARVLVFAAPALALLSAQGIGVILEAARGRLAPVAVAAVALVVSMPVGLVLFHAVRARPRPDAAAASAYVMEARLPSQPVVANTWEYRYYFRNITPRGAFLGDCEAPPQGGPVWLIVQAPTPEQRDGARARLAPGQWDVLGSRHFYGVSVFLIVKHIETSPPRPADRASAGSGENLRNRVLTPPRP
jgi:hypothetical protein